MSSTNSKTVHHEVGQLSLIITNHVELETEKRPAEHCPSKPFP